MFKFLCSIFIGVRIINEMPGSVASGIHCITCARHGGELGLHICIFPQCGGRGPINLDLGTGCRLVTSGQQPPASLHSGMGKPQSLSRNFGEENKEIYYPAEN